MLKKEQKYYSITEVNFMSYLDVIESHNELIKEYIFSDQGVVLQNIDSSVMTHILNILIDKNVVALLYHDSAIVKKSETNSM